MVISPKAAQTAAYIGLAGLGACTSAVLLGWVPGRVVPDVWCPDFLGTAQLFGVLLMLSPCTVRIGAGWLTVALALTGLLML